MLPDFWESRREINASRAIFHQWEQLEASGCIDNFWIAAGLKTGLREGWFFADSDAYKWLEAVGLILARQPDPALQQLVDDFIRLLEKTQAADGYLFTYNQVHFPGVRWQNLQIEHELYCHGHLIEAGVSLFQAAKREDLLAIAKKAANRIVEDFRGKGPMFTPGHEEIEIALLRLHAAVPGDQGYLELARQFLEERGRSAGFSFSILRQNMDVGRRARLVESRRKAYLVEHHNEKPRKLPSPNPSRKPWNATLRWYSSALSGRYFQQHAPIRQQKVPVGHAVRYAYLQTATAMLCRMTGDTSLLPALEQSWEHMVQKRMYVTGGIGSLPVLEGFGQDYELDPEIAYAETCAALGSIFWNREMATITRDARYGDLLEWQLYNAAVTGMGVSGDSYLYNNPLACSGNVTRQAWYEIPCCPSNISRTLASLDTFCYAQSNDSVFIYQYISGNINLDGVILRVNSRLPWDGSASILIENGAESKGRNHGITLSLRQPSWSGRLSVAVNGTPTQTFEPEKPSHPQSASGIQPQNAAMRTLDLELHPGDRVDISFEMPLRILRAHPRVRGHQDKVALSRGPLVYCLESIDNPGIDITAAILDLSTIASSLDASLLGGLVKLTGLSTNGQPLTFIPYHLWGNRGLSAMNVWIKSV